MNWLVVISVITVGTIFLAGGVQSIRCWHCISDNCENDPTENYRASERSCLPGQACQKVYFEMYSENELKGYQSTVRGCSTSCRTRNDFTNCTYELKTTRGCIRKDCCNDGDLCNHGNVVIISSSLVGLLCLICVGLNSYHNFIL